jgi:hypothetical protein
MQLSQGRLQRSPPGFGGQKCRGKGVTAKVWCHTKASRGMVSQQFVVSQQRYESRLQITDYKFVELKFIELQFTDVRYYNNDGYNSQM